MGSPSSARVLLAGALWKAGRLRRAGRLLADAVNRGSEQARTMAGILLVQTGGDAREVVIAGLRDEAASPALVGVLADLGGPEVIDELKRLTISGSPEVATAAAEALRELETS